MKRIKKMTLKISKKVFGILLSLSMLLTNFIPITKVFAITNEEKGDYVEIKLRRANDIHVDGSTATINYGGGYITVTDSNLEYEIDNDYDYGNGDHGTLVYLYTTSSSLNFIMHPNENHEVGYWFNGRPENLNGNEYQINNLNIGQSYDYEFFFNNNEPYSPQPTGASYTVSFENNAWQFDDITVYASIPDKVLNNGPIEVVDTDIITLHNFDSSKMEVRVTAEDGFSTDLVVNGDMTTSFANLPYGRTLPQGQSITFSINPKPNNNPGNENYRVDFGSGSWQLDEECTVTASIDDMVINAGPVEITGDTVIHLQGFDRDTMRIVVIAEDGFTARLFADEHMDTRINYKEDDQVYIPNTIRFEIQKEGGEEHQPFDVDNPEQVGNTTATVRIWGVEGTYEDGGWEHSYNGPGEIWCETRFNINGGAIFHFRSDGETFDGDNFLYNEIEYQYDGEVNDETIQLGLYVPIDYNMKITSVTINGTPYPIPLDFYDRDDWLTHIVDSYVGFTLTVPKTNNNLYEIVIQNNPYDGMFIGGFNWTNDPNGEYITDDRGNIISDEFDDPIKNDAYIPHVNVDLLEVSFSVAGHEYVYTEEDFKNDEFDGEYISYRLEHHPGFKVMNAMFPSEAIIKIRITPDYNYQIGAIYTPGDDIYTKGEEPGVFIIDSSHMLHAGDFSVEIVPGEDTTQIETDAVTEATISLPTNTIGSANVNLIIDDIEPSNEEITRFESYANGYEIKKYLNIHLDQVFFNGNDEDPVFVHIDRLNKKATISLKLAEGIDGDKIVILHDINHSGTMETIEIDSYDKNTNVITFKVDSFSNFAIASKTYTVIDDIAINLEAPISGKKIDVTQEYDSEYDYYYNVPSIRPTATTSSEAFTIDSTEWVNGICDMENPTRCDDLFNGRFQAGDYYYAKIYISSKEGYTLTTDSLANVTVNGRTLSSDDGDEFFTVYGTGDETNTMFIAKIQAVKGPGPELMGDMNGNGKIDLPDIISLLKKYLDIEHPTDEDVEVGDMDGNGKIGLNDIIMLLKAYLNI